MRGGFLKFPACVFQIQSEEYILANASLEVHQLLMALSLYRELVIQLFYLTNHFVKEILSFTTSPFNNPNGSCLVPNILCGEPLGRFYWTGSSPQISLKTNLV